MNAVAHIDTGKTGYTELIEIFWSTAKALPVAFE